MRRHSWSDKGVAFHTVRGEHWKTEYECANGCGVVKVHRHQENARDPKDRHWREWWRNGRRIPGDSTPPCIEAGEVKAI